ncbi:MAG TPA: hypothetical protein VFR67_01170 [Pilimelia sp.]|nr:hypothetical protein [Pilimelia sp.]
MTGREALAQAVVGVGQMAYDAPTPGTCCPFWNATSSMHGRGLWLTRQLCDDLQLRSDARGTTVRLRVPVAA